MLAHLAKVCYIDYMNLLEKTIQLLQINKGNWVAIAKQADVSYSWITKLAQGKIPNPSVVTIEKLLAILATK